MYLAFKHSHLLTGLLAMLMSLVWGVLAWPDARREAAAPGRSTRLVYLVFQSFAGLAALTGIAVTIAGPWQTLMFPYIGLAAFILHSIAAGMSRRMLASPGQTFKRRVALLVQLSALLFAASIMSFKPAFLLTWPQ